MVAPYRPGGRRNRCRIGACVSCARDDADDFALCRPGVSAGDPAVGVSGHADGIFDSIFVCDAADYDGLRREECRRIIFLLSEKTTGPQSFGCGVFGVSSPSGTLSRSVAPPLDPLVILFLLLVR